LRWYGNYKGDLVNPGVFAYIMEVEFIDGSRQLLTEDVTLVR